MSHRQHQIENAQNAETLEFFVCLVMQQIGRDVLTQKISSNY